MDMEQMFYENDAHLESMEDVSVKQACRSITTAATVSSDYSSRFFECSICLDTANDPVVTLCGHLYCWPCMYKWISVKSSFPDPEQHPPSCPICKANISLNTLVPLYGRGTSLSESETSKAVQDVVIPHRPSPTTLNTVIANASRHQSQQIHSNISRSQSLPFHHHQQQQLHDPADGGYASIASSNLCVTAIASFVNPVIVMFGELVPARILGVSDMSLFTLPCPTSSLLTSSMNPRMRRQEMKLEKSLNRVTIFLLCCIILCLLLF